MSATRTTEQDLIVTIDNDQIAQLCGGRVANAVLYGEFFEKDLHTLLTI